MSFYVIFEQKLKKKTPLFELHDSVDIQMQENEEGERVLLFDVGQGVLGRIIISTGQTNIPSIRAFYKIFERPVKKHDSSILMQFCYELKRGFAEGGVDFIHKAADGFYLEFNDDSSIEKQFLKSIADFESFIKYSIENKLTIKHTIA